MREKRQQTGPRKKRREEGEGGRDEVREEYMIKIGERGYERAREGI